METSGFAPEYALQPWRVPQHKAWVTSLVWIEASKPTNPLGGLRPTAYEMATMLKYAIATKQYIVGWNVQFDIQWLIAYGLEELAMKCKWIDGMLLWRHARIEPEYDYNRDQKKRYGLKECVRELWPDEAGYEEGVDFHSWDPEVMAKTHYYNGDDVRFTLRGVKHWWNQLTQAQRQAAIIEAECIPIIAAANYNGLVIDTLATHSLQAKMVADAKAELAILEPDGMTEVVVRSPTKLAALMFDVWKLPVLKENVGKKTKKVSRSTDKEVLHELAFIDPRAKHVKQYREALGNKTKFADAVLKSVAYNADGRTHQQAFVFGTYSGRVTYASKQKQRAVATDVEDSDD